MADGIARMSMPAGLHEALRQQIGRFEAAVGWEVLEDPATQLSGRRLLEERIPALGPFLDEATARVDTEGALVIGDCFVDSDKWVAVLSSAFGLVSSGGNGFPPRLVFDVTPRRTDAGELLTGSRGVDEFWLHTDSATHVVPHAYAVLACVNAEPGHGGESLVMHVDDVVARLHERAEDDAVRLLGDAVYPFLADLHEAGSSVRVGAVAEHRDGAYRVRYGAEAIAAGLEHHPVDEPHRAALRAFEDATHDAGLLREFALRRGDVLVLENSRVLHGRRSFALEANRLLKRCKIHRRRP